MTKTLELCKVHSFSTLPNLCQCTTAWNTDAPNCYIMQGLSVSDCLPVHQKLDRGCHMA